MPESTISFSGVERESENCLNEKRQGWGGFLLKMRPSINHSFYQHLLRTCQCIQHRASYDRVLIWGTPWGFQSILGQGPLEEAGVSSEPDEAWHRFPGNQCIPFLLSLSLATDINLFHDQLTKKRDCEQALLRCVQQLAGSSRATALWRLWTTSSPLSSFRPHHPLRAQTIDCSTP